jgi:4-hydroxy-3-polyprenylbenzoate decarboxylase
VVSVSFTAFTDYPAARKQIDELLQSLSAQSLDQWPLWILTEDSAWMSSELNNFLWASFTRSQPAKDIYGIDALFVEKHWTCKAPMIIDARIKLHHAPVLETDPEVSKRVDKMFAKGGALHGKVKGL